MDKVIKIQSNQGSGFDGTKRLCDFDIPQGVYDLSSSYINLVSSVITQDDGANNGQGIYEIKTATGIAGDFGNSNENVFPSVSLVKNAHLSSAKDGQITNVRRIDCLQSTLHQFKKSFEENYSEEYSTFSNMVSKKFTRNSPYRELVKEGTALSRNVDQHIKIPLKDLFPYCDHPEYDANRHGATRLGLELQVDLLNVQTSTDDNQLAYQGRNTFTFTTGVALPTDQTTLTTDYTFRTLEESPYFTGMKLDFVAVPQGGGGNYSPTRMITGIEHLTGTDQGKIRLTFNAIIFDAAPALTGKTYDITATIHNITAPSKCEVSFPSASLVLSVVGSPTGADAQPREYKHYASEEYSAGSATPSHQQQVNIEPNCRNVYICYPNPIISSNGALTSASSYRLRHNDLDLTNRNVNFFTPVHKERLLMSLSNSQYEVKSLIQLVPAAKEDETQRVSLGGTTNTIDVKMIGAPVKMMGDYSLLQINHDGIGGAGLGNVIVYKECIKSV